MPGVAIFLVGTNILPFLILPMGRSATVTSLVLTLGIFMFVVIRFPSPTIADLPLFLWLVAVLTSQLLLDGSVNAVEMAWNLLPGYAFLLPSILSRIRGQIWPGYSKVIFLALALFWLIQVLSQLFHGYWAPDFFSGPFISVSWGHYASGFMLAMSSLIVFIGTTISNRLRLLTLVSTLLMLMIADEKFAMVALGIGLIVGLANKQIPLPMRALGASIGFGAIYAAWIGFGPTLSSVAGAVSKRSSSFSSGRRNQLEISESTKNGFTSIADQPFATWAGVLSESGPVALGVWIICVALLLLLPMIHYQASLGPSLLLTGQPALAAIAGLPFALWTFAEIPAVVTLFYSLYWWSSRDNVSRENDGPSGTRGFR